MIVECYLDAKYYHYDLVEVTDLVDVYAHFANLANVDDISRRMQSVAWPQSRSALTVQ